MTQTNLFARSSQGQMSGFLRQFTQGPGLPFAQVVQQNDIQELLARHCPAWREDLYTPAVTLALFVGQAVDPDPSLRQAVARFAAQRQMDGLPAISTDTGAYCKARQRLSENAIAELARGAGQRTLAFAPPRWTWQGRDVKVVDGTTLSMPDTPANQKAYPQPRSQKPGVGFPLMRAVVLFSLAVGVVLDAAFGPYRGKETGETALFRDLHHRLQWGDVVLADRYYCSYFEFALLQEQGVDLVARLHQCRPHDFRQGKHLKDGDRLVTWDKPQCPAWMDRETYGRLPDQIQIRLTRILLPDATKRTSRVVVATTLLDIDRFPKKAMAQLYRLRWHGELDLRSLKTVLQMDVLRCKTPEMVRKEIWTHLLAYNLIRKTMAQAAQVHDKDPRHLSFKATLQILAAFAHNLRECPDSNLAQVCDTLWKAIVEHPVGNRPDRLEPRRKKRRPKPYKMLNTSRAEARKLETAGR